MLHTKIPANCLDRIFKCPQSIDFGTGPVRAPGSFRPNSLNSKKASVRGKTIDELTKNKFYRSVYGFEEGKQRKLFSNDFKEYWGTVGESENQLLADKASQFMLKELNGCDELFCDRYDDLIDLFRDFPNSEIYTNPNGITVCYNQTTDTEFAFGASVDFGGTRGDTVHLIELKTGTGYGKDLEVQLKVSALACILNHEEINRVICGCYNVDKDNYLTWTYSREELLDYITEVRKILLQIFSDKQPEFLTGVAKQEWCNNCDCKRCPYSVKNRNNKEFQTNYYNNTEKAWDEELAKGLW